MRKIPLAGLISILGIPGLGLGTARKMLYEVKTLRNFIHILDNNYVAQLDIPNHIKLNLTNWYKHAESQKLLRDLVELNIPEWM
jgi:NAD-dependent DNA ligase